MTSETTLIGRTVAGRFRIVERIGEGGMATVYRAEQDAEPHEVAVKIMNADLAADEKFVRRFRREARSAARLEHPSSVRIFDHGVDAGLPFIAMELLRGAELVQILHHERRLSEARAARIMLQVLSALAAAHAKGIVHRDLKPENIMISRTPGASGDGEDVVKVLDFGLAKVMERAPRKPDDRAPDSVDGPPSSLGKSALTMMGTIMGTPEYMSPEQSRGGTIDARSDLYACGVLLFHLITGRVPFTAELPIEIVMMHVTTEPPKPSAFTPSIHPALERLILQTLEKDPADRPASAIELSQRLTALLPELATTRHASLRPVAMAAMPAEPAVHSKVATTQPSMDAPVVPNLPVSLAATSAADVVVGPARAVAVTLDEQQVEDAMAPTVPAPTLVPDDKPIAPAKVIAPIAPAAFAEMRRITPSRGIKKRSGLSNTAALLIGAGFGALVLVVAALLLLRE